MTLLNLNPNTKPFPKDSNQRPCFLFYLLFVYFILFVCLLSIYQQTHIYNSADKLCFL